VGRRREGALTQEKKKRCVPFEEDDINPSPLCVSRIAGKKILPVKEAKAKRGKGKVRADGQVCCQRNG